MPRARHVAFAMPTVSGNRASDDKYDAIAKEYDDRYVGPRWDVYDHVTLATAGTFMPPPGAHVLDAGAGSGKFARMLLQRGYEVTLLDPSKEMLEVAERKIKATLPGAKANFVVGTIEKLDFPDGTFDFFFCEGDPISYCITTHRQAVGELLRVIKPGAGFYASVDNRVMGTLGLMSGGHVEPALRCFEEGKSFDPYGVPVHAFHPHELKALFEGAGATDVRVTGKVLLMNFMPDPILQNVFANEDLKRRLFAMETAIAQDPAMTGLAGHLHVVGRKPSR
jgi:ubiquinone/menaquinone biosynthesis C-methylase UbiE